MIRISLYLATLLLLFSCDKSHGVHIEVEPLTGFPTNEVGYELGVSGAYAGVSNGYVILAGGCNFPEEPVYEGGAKRYYSGIYIAPLINSEEPNQLNWVKVGELPSEVAYGASIQGDDAVYFVGGMNDIERFKFTLKLSVQMGQLVIEHLPDLPFATDNISGALRSNNLTISARNSEETYSNQQLTISLASLSRGWTLGDSVFESPRVQFISFVVDSAYCVSSGFFSGDVNLSPKTYADMQWEVEGKWYVQPNSSEVKDLTFTGGSVVDVKDKGVFALGGVNLPIFQEAITRGHLMNDITLKDSLSQEHKRYLQHPSSWYRFNDGLYMFNKSQWRWQHIADSSYFARAGASVVPIDDGFLVIGGELKPGVRTPEIVRVRLY